MMNTNKKTQNTNASTTENNSSVFDKDEVFEFIDNGVREKNLDWDRKEVYKRLKKTCRKRRFLRSRSSRLIIKCGLWLQRKSSRSLQMVY